MNDSSRPAADPRTRLVNAFEQMTDPVLLHDPEDRLVAANRAAYAAFAPDVLVLGIPFKDMLASAARQGLFGDIPGGPDRWLSQRRAARGSGKNHEFELQFQDGRYFWVREQPLAGGDIMTVATDVTGMRRREVLRSAEKAETESADRAKTTFIANLSHELRTPLNAILGFSEMMMREVFGPLGAGRYREYAADIAAAARHLLAVVNDVLDLSRLQATGEMPLNIGPTDPAAVAESCRRLMAGMSDHAGLALRLEIAPGLTPIEADERRVRQVVLNLLGNAVKFTPTGGAVTLSVITLPAGGVEFAVADTGPGMSTEEIRSALARFGRGTQSQRERRHGTGLGLAIAHAIVEAHGGTLTIESKPGSGTIVRARLRSKPPAARS